MGLKDTIPDAPLNNESAPTLLKDPTAKGAKRIFLRFVLVAMVANFFIGSVVVVYNVIYSMNFTNDKIEEVGQRAVKMAQRLRSSRPGTDSEVIGQAAELLNLPMALFSKNGRLVFATEPKIFQLKEQIFQGKPRPGIRIVVSDELEELSGGWLIRPFSQEHYILVIVPYGLEDEGLFRYMTISAGLAGLGMGLSVLVLLFAANWMLRKPLSRLVIQLTGALAKDIQRRKNAEARAVAARRDVERHLAFMDCLIDASSEVGIIAADSHDVIQVFNQAAQKILTFDPERLIGKTNLEDLRQRLRRTLFGRSSQRSKLMYIEQGEELWVDEKGEEHLLRIDESVIDDTSGQQIGRVLIFIDITKRRSLEAELQLSELQLIQSAKLATLGEMSTGIAHELNQPLNNIALLSSRMLRRLNREELPIETNAFFEDRLKQIQSQIERASKIIEHLRTFGRPKHQRLSSVNLQQPVSGVMLFLREQLVRNGIEIDIDIPADIPQVQADEAQLEQVLMNLLINSRDALNQLVTGECKKRVSIVARHFTMEGEIPAVRIEVSDTGPGIAPEIIDRIFEPFFTTKEVGRGTGLGLSISYGLVRDFGGVLEATSNLGQGTTFYITLKESVSK